MHENVFKNFPDADISASIIWIPILDKDTFDEIRQAGALPLIYCQLLSMQHLPTLVNLAAQVEQQKPVNVPDIEQLFGAKDDLFKF